MVIIFLGVFFKLLSYETHASRFHFRFQVFFLNFLR